MSKSIYEKALETIKALHEDWFELNVLHDTFEIPIQALDQARKQEKLLELYKKLVTAKDEIISMAYFDDRYYVSRYKEKSLEKEIKEVENE